MDLCLFPSIEKAMKWDRNEAKLIITDYVYSLDLAKADDLLTLQALGIIEDKPDSQSSTTTISLCEETETNKIPR